MEELTGHRVFIRTAELSSITKAAESLGLTRAAASRALMSLESELGAALFTRTTRHVALTAFGSQVLDTCKELVGLADQLKAEALHQSSAPTGTIRVACSVSFGQTYLAGALKRFLGEFPSINMELTLLDRPAHLLTDNIDLALEVTNTPEPGLIARRLTSCGSLLCAAPAFLADRPPVTAPADLAKLPTLVSTRFGSRWKFEREGESSEPKSSAIEPRKPSWLWLIKCRAASGTVGRASRTRCSSASFPAASSRRSSSRSQTTRGLESGTWPQAIS